MEGGGKNGKGGGLVRGEGSVDGVEDRIGGWMMG